MRGVSVALALVSGVAYNTWLLAWWLSPFEDPFTGFVSELAAADQPNSWLFRTADVTVGVALLVIVALGWTAWRGWIGRATPWLAGGLAVVGSGTIVDAVFNMPCAATHDEVCRAAELENPLDADHFVHTVASVVVSIGLVVALAAVAWGCWRMRRRTEAIVASVLGVIVASLLVTMTLWYYTVQTGHGRWQVAQIVASSLFFAWSAVRLRGAGRTLAADSRHCET